MPKKAISTSVSTKLIIGGNVHLVMGAGIVVFKKCNHQICSRWVKLLGLYGINDVRLGIKWMTKKSMQKNAYNNRSDKHSPLPD